MLVKLIDREAKEAGGGAAEDEDNPDRGDDDSEEQTDDSLGDLVNRASALAIRNEASSAMDDDSATASALLTDDHQHVPSVLAVVEPISPRDFQL